MSQVLTIAYKELRDGIRNRWVLAISLLFAALAMGISWFGAAASGQVGFSSISATIASLTSLSTFLMPLIDLMLAYDAVVGEEEGGTLVLLLTYPLTRTQLLLGKFLGHGLILSLSTIVGFGGAAIVIAIFVPDISIVTLLGAFARFIISSIALGLVFVAFAYVLCCFATEKSTAAGLALGIWFVFVLAFDLVLLAVLVMSKGALSSDALPWLLLFSPTDIYRLINLVALESSGQDMGVMALAKDLPVTVPMLWMALLAWLVLVLGAAHWAFIKRVR